MKKRILGILVALTLIVSAAGVAYAAWPRQEASSTVNTVTIGDAVVLEFDEAVNIAAVITGSGEESAESSITVNNADEATFVLKLTPSGVPAGTFDATTGLYVKFAATQAGLAGATPVVLTDAAEVLIPSTTATTSTVWILFGLGADAVAGTWAGEVINFTVATSAT